jgi:hypothetical protein
MDTQRLSIYYSHSTREILEEITRLESLYRAIHGRASNVDMFVGTQWENNTRALHSLTLYFKSGQEEAVHFFAEQTVGAVEANT